MRTITLRHPARCADCGAELNPGGKAKCYPGGKVYGIGCHAKPTNPNGSSRLPRATRRPRYPMIDYDFEVERERIGAPAQFSRSCGCIDYPCCGH